MEDEADVLAVVAAVIAAVTKHKRKGKKRKKREEWTKKWFLSCQPSCLCTEKTLNNEKILFFFTSSFASFH